MSDLKVVGVIPSRYGSSRLPGKPLKPILGKPMIQWVYERAKRAAILKALYVATDDLRIFETVMGFGGLAVMTSIDHQSGSDRIAEALRSIEADIVVNIQGDQPFIDPKMIEEVVAPLLKDPSLNMCTLKHAVKDPKDFADPSVVKVVTDKYGDALYFSRSLIPFPREKVRHVVYEHVGIYAYRKSFLCAFSQLDRTLLEQVESLEQLRALEHGFSIRVVETKTIDHEFSGFSVDTMEDLIRAEELLVERGYADNVMVKG